MKRLYLLISAITILTLTTPIVTAQSSVADPNSTAIKLTASVERLGERLYLQLTNPNEIREFRGAAQIKLGGSSTSTETVRLELEVGPGKTRIFPFKTSTESSEQYALTIFNQAGTLILYQDAPIKQTSREVLRTLPSATQLAKPAGADEIKVQPRLSATAAEAAAKTESPARILTFDLKAPTPIAEASLVISAKDFKQRQPVSIRKSAQIEFKLPDELKESILTYTLTDATGRVRASGEVDLDQLMQADSIIVSGLTLDKPTYAPGDAARIVIQLQGQTPRGYRMEVVAKEGNNILYKDLRRSVVQNNSSRLEFVIDLPSEPKAAVSFEYSIFGVQTGRLLSSGIREIVISEHSSKSNVGDGSRLPP